MQVVELSREIPLAMLARFASRLGKFSETMRLARLLSPQRSMPGRSRSRLRWRRTGGQLTSVKVIARDEYLQTLPRKRMAAGVLLRSAVNEVVLIEPTYKDTWEIPGGVVEAGEAPWVAAERELEEELGLIRRDMPVLVVDYVSDAPDGMPEGLLWIFDGGLLNETELDGLHETHSEEVRSVELLPIEDAARRTKRSLALRLRVALKAALAAETAQALQEAPVPHVTVYCDSGLPRHPMGSARGAATNSTREFAPVL